jgi:hypothetical protein
MAKRMSEAGGALRSRARIISALSEARTDFREIAAKAPPSGSAELADFFKLRNSLIEQIVYLSAMLDYIDHGGKSRGSAFMKTPRANCPTLPWTNLSAFCPMKAASTIILRKWNTGYPGSLSPHGAKSAPSPPAMSSSRMCGRITAAAAFSVQRDFLLLCIDRISGIRTSGVERAGDCFDDVSLESSFSSSLDTEVSTHSGAGCFLCEEFRIPGERFSILAYGTEAERRPDRLSYRVVGKAVARGDTQGFLRTGALAFILISILARCQNCTLFTPSEIFLLIL